MKTLQYLTIGLLAVSVPCAADEPKNKEKDKAEVGHLLERAKQAKAEGCYEEARELAEQIHKVHGMKKKHPAGKHEDLSRLKAEIAELHRAGKHEEAEKLQEKMKQALHQMHREGHPNELPPEARLEHLMQAIKHLRTAGINEPAEQLEQMAGRMRHEIEARRHHEGAAQADEIRALKEQLEQLRRTVDELRGQLKKAQSKEEVKKPAAP